MLPETWLEVLGKGQVTSEFNTDTLITSEFLNYVPVKNDTMLNCYCLAYST